MADENFVKQVPLGVWDLPPISPSNVRPPRGCYAWLVMQARTIGWVAAAGLALAIACGGSSDNTLYAPTDAGPDGVAGTGGGSGGSGATGGSGGGLSCDSDKDCTPMGLLCLKSAGQCVECLVGTDCSDNSDCIEHRCVQRCVNSLDCDNGLVCEAISGRCVECVVAADCGADQQCVSNTCREFCDSDNDCTPQGMLCDFATGTCYIPGSGGSGGGGGTGGSGATGGSGGTGGGSCGSLNAVVLFDSTGSMSEVPDTGGSGTKYSIAAQSFVSWANTARSVRVEVIPHPQPPASPPPTTCTTDADCGAYGPCSPFGCLGAVGADTSCTASDYAALVPLAALPGAVGDIEAALDPSTVSPTGGSPHAVVLEAGVLAARRIAGQRPGDKTIVVLMADGDPTSCKTEWADVVQVAAQGLAGTPSIPVHVVAISSTTTGFDDVAYAGGTAFATPAADAAVGNAMAQIVSNYPCP